MTSPEGLRRFEVDVREAVEVTEENVKAVAEWCGGHWAITDDPLVSPSSVRYPTGWVHAGDVLVRHGEQFYDVPKWLFERDLLPRWRDVTGEPPRQEPMPLGVLTGEPLRVTRRW